MNAYTFGLTRIFGIRGTGGLSAPAKKQSKREARSGHGHRAGTPVKVKRVRRPVQDRIDHRNVAGV